MPVRSLNSSVIKWPDRQTVHQAVQKWLEAQAGQHPELLRGGYFGSYARGDWGVGSDLDLVLIVKESQLPFVSRSLEWDASGLPVPADVLTYTLAEWDDLAENDTRFYRTLRQEIIWVFVRK